MRLLLLTAGSRGDVGPFLALARRAAAAGHDVQLGLTREFVDRGRAVGVEVAPLDGDYARLVEAQGVSPRAALRSYRSVVRPMMEGILRSAVDAALAFRPDLIAYHPKILSAPTAAERLGVPHVVVEIVPTLTPTREFAAAGITAADLGPLNPLTYRLAAGAGALFTAVVRDLRAGLGLPPRQPAPPPAQSLVPVSRALLDRPGDWPETTHITGQWSDPVPDHGSESPRPAGERPDAELDAFLRRDGVLYAGFGSMATGDAEARGRVVVQAARAVGRPVLVVTGWGGLHLPVDLAGEDVLVRREVCHAAVLPRCAAAVHHAGAGTAHAVVRSATVSVPVPFLADQPFWGRALHRRGLATPPIPARRLTTARLTASLRALPAPAATVAAARTMAAEDGCGTALDLLHRVVPAG